MRSPSPPLVDEHAAAKALGLSVHYLRKDRRTKRLLPFYRIGRAVRYDLHRVAAELARLERRASGVRP